MGGKVSGGKLKGFWMWEQDDYEGEKSIHYFYCFFNDKLKHYFIVLEPTFGRWEVKEANRYKINFSGDICYDDAGASKREMRKVKSKLNNRRIEAEFQNKCRIDLPRNRGQLVKLYPEEIPEFLLEDVRQELQTRRSRYDFLLTSVLNEMGEGVPIQTVQDDFVHSSEAEKSFVSGFSTIGEKLGNLKKEIRQEFSGDQGEDVWKELIQSVSELIQIFENNTRPGMFRQVMIFLAVFIVSCILF